MKKLSATVFLMEQIESTEKAVENGNYLSAYTLGYHLHGWEECIYQHNEEKEALKRVNEWLNNHGEQSESDLSVAILYVMFTMAGIVEKRKGNIL